MPGEFHDFGLSPVAVEFKTGDGDDTLVGSFFCDYFRSHGGHDLIYSGNGHDTVEAGGGNDLVFAGEGDDVVLGEAGDDALVGDLGDDILHGGDGHDRLFGNDGLDRLNGGIGADSLVGGSGADSLSGGADPDSFRLNNLSESMLGAPGAYRFDTITDYQAGDVLASASVSSPTVITAITGTIGSLNASAVSSLLTASVLTANAVRAFQVSGWSGTFVAFNDGVAGFNSSSDGLVFLQNYNLVLASYPIQIT